MPTLQTTQPLKSLLVIRYGAMGDLVHAASAVSLIKRAYPELQVDWMSAPMYVPLLEAFRDDTGQPLLRNVLPYEKSKPGAFLRAVREVRSRHYDAVANLHPSFKTALISLFSASQVKTTYKKEKLPVQGERQRALSRRHAAEDFLQPFLALFPAASNPPMLPAAANSPRLSVGASPLDSLEPSSCLKPYLALIIGVGGKRANRGWPLEHFERLVRLVFAQSDLNVVLVGGPEEKLAAETLMATFENPTAQGSRLYNGCGRWSLLETAAVLAKASAVIGGDTGPLHLASCFDVPIIAIFGPTSIKRTGPLGHQGKRFYLLPEETLACWPCEAPDCHLEEDSQMLCVRQSSPERVFDILRSVIAP